MTERKGTTQNTTAASRLKRRNVVSKRISTSTSQSDIPKKKIQMDADNPLATVKEPKTRKSAQQQHSKKSMAKIPSIVIESDSDHDKNNA